MANHENGREIAYLYRRVDKKRLEAVHVIVDSDHPDGCWKDEVMEQDIFGCLYETERTVSIPVRVVPEGKPWRGTIGDDVYDFGLHFTPKGSDESCE